MEVTSCTSYDFNFNVQDIFNKYLVEGKSSDLRKFWMTTGLFPQEILIDLKKLTTVSEVRFTSHAVKKVRLEGSEARSATSFKVIAESEFKKNDKLQDESIRVWRE
eukprot:TRINITY_DN2092_c0_g2_i2.p2 TRINITY_DN2092_c0_g2~~TRINITY_DN2092_c0_g2_i2.p2  ORF type:complete len:106 (-),score=28.83 TRINITY_DN2092_c0_g2_i2:219-536(-)